jgi:hypothetical protein
LFASFAFAQHDMSHHDADVKQHGAEAMGFDQDKTTHHFRLTRDGGYVMVEANSAKDAETIKQVRDHLATQARKFVIGDFAAPEHTHGQVPPGVAEMKRLNKLIDYHYDQLSRGAILRITSKNEQAVTAIHDFLKFQITDHKTGDPTTVEGQ